MQKYNTIYEKLVNDRGDIIGHVAYSLYKADKADFIKTYKKQNNGSPPTDKDIDGYHSTICTESHLERYKLQAENIINETLVSSLEDMKEKMQIEQAQNLRGHIEEAIKPIKPSGFYSQLGKDVVLSLISTIITIVIFSVIVFAVSLYLGNISLNINPDGSASIQNIKNK